MNHSPQPSWPQSHQRSPPHSTETEHRLTVAEETLERHADRMSLHEKVMLALAGGIYVLFQDRFPQIAAVIKSAIP